MTSIARARSRRRISVARLIGDCAAYAVLLVGAAAALAPFIWMVLISLRPITEFADYPGTIWPHTWAWSNYPEVLQSFAFAKYFMNSLIMAGSQTVLTLAVCSIAGYAFARLSFPWRDTLFLFVLATMMVPFQITMIPLFLIIRGFPLSGGNTLLGVGGTGLLNTFPGLVIPWIASGFGIFLCRQFFQTLPLEMEDAGRVDGASELRIYWSIFLPLAGPVLAVLAVFTFQGAWNSFIWPLLVTTNDAVKPLQLALALLSQEYGTRFDLLMAGTVIASLPIIVLFLAAQRSFIEGVALTGLR
jgi:multiple sugar transport system permease protein